MVEALMIALRESKDMGQFKGSIPESTDVLRQVLARELLENTASYGLENTKVMRKRLRGMERPGQQTMAEMLLAASKLLGLKIRVYHGMEVPIVFVHDPADTSLTVICLQCISLVHYNPLYRRTGDEDREEGKIVQCCKRENERENGMTESRVIDVVSEDVLSLDIEEERPKCDHVTFHTKVTFRECEESFCGLLDTGAQVSLMSMNVYERLIKVEPGLELKSCDSMLIGVGSSREKPLGYVEVCLFMNGTMTECMPFAVVKTESIPCCFLLGANFLAKNRLEIDFSKSMILHKRGEMEKFVIGIASNNPGEASRMDVSSYLGLVELSDSVSDEANPSMNDGVIESMDDGMIESMNEAESDIYDGHVAADGFVPRYVIHRDDLLRMQRGNHAIRKLRKKIIERVSVKEWKEKPIAQFKRCVKDLRIVDDVLVKGNRENYSVVVSFPFLVDIVSKSHAKLNHIGRQKLIHIVKSHFWHPALDKVCREVCKCCHYCQLNKTSRIDSPPPVKKIASRYPFEMVAVDLLQLPRTKQGNIGLLVVLDHYSKWLTAVPIKDKKAKTVANIMREKVLPNFVKIPDKVLSDNGGEFTGWEFEKMLEESNIQHVYSSPYYAPGNGACERANRTLIQLLKLDQNEDASLWDQSLNSVLITYNNSYHSTIKMSPSQMILNNAHVSDNRFPLDNELLEVWKEGNPNFRPFTVNQRVIKKECL